MAARPRQWLAAGALALWCGGPAAAQPAPEPAHRAVPRSVLPGLGTGDPRHAVDVAEAPWWSLGRVQTELGGRCTGALVGPRSVLTAAHCLVAPRLNRLVQPGSVHVLLGYALGRWAAHGRVQSYVVGPGYVPGGRGPAAADWAVLTLEQPLPVPPDRILPLLRALPPPRTPLMLAGYQQDRPETLLADESCRVIGLTRDAAAQPMLVHDCAGTRGASGGPVLARLPDGRWGVVGIASIAAIDMAMGAAVPVAVLPPP